MVDLVVGSITLTGTNEQNGTMRPMAERIMAALGERIEPFSVVVKEREKMPVYGYDNDENPLYAEGFWRESRRRMLLADDLFKHPAGVVVLNKTLGHESIHVLDSDWLTKWHRRRLMALMFPEPDNYHDGSVGNDYYGYAVLPPETLAAWGSAAVYGWERPAYSRLFRRRKFPHPDYPAVKEAMLASKP